jgi:hypothetical protein
MHPMSLFERGESSGVVSVSDVCAGKDIGVQTTKSPSLEELVAFVVGGGWPGSIGKTPRQSEKGCVHFQAQSADVAFRRCWKIRNCAQTRGWCLCTADNFVAPMTV